ncbi:hypothetical protein PYW08_012902 [Mythimna loreyi]|uniref:Uncharacterized protein n=1 Tax=Mythimna loreyi TaxID=667449 RepID=A0ACC2Q1Q1_9NEOP|nr:hypothetical protein PYW08_012902 [Mythimna loreyi]
MYSKREGTSGIRGQLYGTKLISLLYFRAFHDVTIKEFQLASNVDNIGNFADICFKAKVDGFVKPVSVFIQTKHRENENQNLKNDLATYFHSYLKIRKSFERSNSVWLFNGTFDDTECLFVIYTTAKGDLGNDSVTSAFSGKLNDLIDTVKVDVDGTPTGTSGTAMKQQKREENVELLRKVAMMEQATSLAERIAYFIDDDANYETMLSDDLVLLYHIILAQKVLEVTEIQPEGHRTASFRHDFFNTNDEYLIKFKDKLFKEILKKRITEPDDVKRLLSEFLTEPSDATKLSKLIGTVITYNNGRLEFDKQFTEDFKPLLDNYVSRSTVNEAVEMAATEILSSRKFKVPAAFGNKDLIISGREEDIETKLSRLSSRIVELVDKYKSSDNVIIDDTFEDGLLKLNGSIVSAIGNIFVLDNNPKLMKITENSESLGPLAKRLYKKLNDGINNLHDLKFYFKFDKLPKLSFDCSEYENNIARDFLKRLLFYTKQANEEGVEKHLKSEIEEYQRDYPNYFQVKTDAIFLKYHNEIQKWWMELKQVTFLTRESDLFNKAINNIIKDPLMSSINVTYMSKIKQYEYKFSEDALSSLNLLNQHKYDVIISENSTLTVVKVLQLMKNKDVVVLDVDYVMALPTNDRNALRAELTNTNTEKVIIFICDKIRNTRNEKKFLLNIANSVQDKNTIIITNNVKSFEILQKYFPKVNNIVHDHKISLIDMSNDSQKCILESARVMFQGTEVRLDLIIDDKSKAYVKGDVLNQIINEETIVVGKQIVNRNYDEMKHLHVDRRLKKAGDDDVYFKTLNDRDHDVVLVTAEPGTGKSTLLTHLSLKTKELYPEVWIVRVNLLEYSKEFSKWKEEKSPINLLEALKFICKVIVSEKLGNENNVEIVLREENCIVDLKECSGDHSTEFQLKLFLHFYQKNKLIFLFDGFDEICPHYTNEVIKFFKTIRNGRHRMWITSRSYNEVKTILQHEFGPSYEIENFSYMEMQRYLENFWEHNLKLEELNTAQLKNVKEFIEYMSKLQDVKLNGFAIQLHSVYMNAVHYLFSEIKFKHIPMWINNKNDYDRFYCQVKDSDYMTSLHKNNREGNPLNLLLAAVFVESNIKSVNNKGQEHKDSDDNNSTKKWNLEINGFTFFERFLETKMKIIRFQDKNEMNIFNPDIIITYDKELTNFISKHKKLSAYALFKQHSHTLFSTKDLEEIQETIRFIEKGEEKTGLIYGVANEVPIFILSEYFAIEYVCDCLKNEEDIEKQAMWIDFIFEVIFSTQSFMNIRNIFDHKMKADNTLMGILENHKEEIFNKIMEQGRLSSQFIVGTYVREIDFVRQNWALSTALSEQLQNFILFFVKLLKCYIKESNLNNFLEIVKKSQLLTSACTYKCEVLLIFIIDMVRELDEAKLTSVLHDNFSFLPYSTICNYVKLSSKKIVEHLFENEQRVEEA